MPRFECTLSELELRTRLADQLIDLLNLIKDNMNKYFSEDKKISNNFNETISSDADISGWKDHAFYHTP